MIDRACTTHTLWLLLLCSPSSPLRDRVNDIHTTSLGASFGHQLCGAWNLTVTAEQHLPRAYLSCQIWHNPDRAQPRGTYLPHQVMSLVSCKHWELAAGFRGHDAHRPILCQLVKPVLLLLLCFSQKPGPRLRASFVCLHRAGRSTTSADGTRNDIILGRIQRAGRKSPSSGAKLPLGGKTSRWENEQVDVSDSNVGSPKRCLSGAGHRHHHLSIGIAGGERLLELPHHLSLWVFLERRFWRTWKASSSSRMAKVAEHHNF